MPMSASKTSLQTNYEQTKVSNKKDRKQNYYVTKHLAVHNLETHNLFCCHNTWEKSESLQYQR